MAKLYSFEGSTRFEFEDDNRNIVIIYATDWKAARDYWNELRNS